MNNKEKVIKGLECCIFNMENKCENKCNECPYQDPSLETCYSFYFLFKDMIGLLKEQKRYTGYWTKVSGPDNAGNIYCECSNCHNCDEFAQNVEVPFCWHCGTKMGGVVNAAI